MGLIIFIELNTLNDIKVKFLIVMFPDVSIRIIKEGVVAERGVLGKGSTATVLGSPLWN